MELPRYFNDPQRLNELVVNATNKSPGIDSDVCLVPQFSLAIHAYKSLDINSIGLYSRIMNSMDRVIDGKYELINSNSRIARVETMKVLRLIDGIGEGYTCFTVSELGFVGNRRTLLDSEGTKQVLQIINENLYGKLGYNFLKVESPNFINAENYTVKVTDVANSVDHLIRSL